MADPVVENVEQPAYLGMSDAEIMNAPPPEPVEAETAEESTDTPADEASDAADDAQDEPVTGVPTEEDSDDEPGAAKGEEDEADEGDAPENKTPEAKDPKDPADEVKEPVEKVEEKSAVDFEAEYKRLLTPFKANGRDIQVKNVDDAIALMQMGANYNKKMAALKPNLKLMKLLENNNLLDESKLSFLIDLDKKDPGAINKLVKDSGIDPMDLDAEKAGAYKQSSYTVDDRQVELDTVLDELEGSPTYNQTLDIVSNKWDGASKQVIAGSPQLLKVIDAHVASGIYDLIQTEIESERVFGRLNGLSDIDAYRKVGDAIEARGGFNHLAGNTSQGKPEAKAPVIVTPKPKPVEDDKLKEKRRAASSTKPVVPSSNPKDFNPLALSDDEFNKLVNKQLL